jgi:redox-sensitive bicupin YhaK (pirin superfamily)
VRDASSAPPASPASVSRRKLLAAAAAAPLAAACRTAESYPAPSGEATGAQGAAAKASPPGKAGERDVSRLVRAVATREGAGVHLRRSLGGQALSMLDPFLLLDEIHSDRREEFAAGFPEHPHRGFETVTYVIDGAMEHGDSLGNRGLLGPGAAQWMTAGRGIVHSEMPRSEKIMWGFQLWVNLAAREKMKKPRYQDIRPESIPEVSADGAKVRVVAGEIAGARGPVDGIAIAPRFFDVTLGRGQRLAHPLPASHNAFVYVIEGDALVGPSKKHAGSGDLAVLGPGEGALVSAEGGARFLLLSGEPIGEPVARYGPFVMNTDEELRQAVSDYRSGKLTSG